jgi:PilX N-terminal
MNIPPRQRGAAALAVTLLLLFTLTLVVGFAGRNLVFEQRSSANQARSTQAFEAAEAGLQWAQAMLDDDTPIGADCEPSTAPGDKSFRERFLEIDAASRHIAPRTWDDAGTPTTLQAACVLAESDRSCSCPSAGPPALETALAVAAQPAFAVRFSAAPRGGMVQLDATGCDDIATACLPASAAPSSGGANARAQVVLALLPALATVPVAALTARGEIAAEGGLTLVNTDAAAGGLTAQAGGNIALPFASLATLPQMSGPDSVAAYEAQLAAADGERLLARFLGLDRDRWRQLPGVRRLTCPADCTTELAQAIGPGTTHPLVWIAGDLRLDGPVAFGSGERPLLLVVEGQIRLGGGVQLHGAIVGLGTTWDTSGSADATVHGALVALGSVGGNGTPTIVYDAGVLARLHGQLGSFARVPGSWRDF